ncbi:MAG: replication-associated recombination protein A [Deltaproteobacteria bacterium]|nr:replication-associated recombination protein A [Deltaproteobacteria bacterium]
MTQRIYQPLAERMRPKTLDEFAGQSHIMGKNKPLRKMIDGISSFKYSNNISCDNGGNYSSGEDGNINNNRKNNKDYDACNIKNFTLQSMILWGPPGCGKTTLAKIIAEISGLEFYQISAVSSGIKEIREILDKTLNSYNNNNSDNNTNNNLNNINNIYNKKNKNNSNNLNIKAKNRHTKNSIDNLNNNNIFFNQAGFWDSENYKSDNAADNFKEDSKIIKNEIIRKPILLFIDEIHRFNKIQQDSLLHSIEDGSIILIGATTENPSFEITSPILSRCAVFTLNPLDDEDLNYIIDRALKKDIFLSKKKIIIKDEGIKPLINFSGKDARIMLNALERAVNLTAENENGEIILTDDIISSAYLRADKYDRMSEEHYNTISAFIKSLRGSDPDAAVFYLAKMLNAGEDPLFIARRMVILASEDIGNAEPYALTLSISCFNAVKAIGMPESRIILSQCATYLASCPKSNASYTAIEEAIKDAKSFPDVTVPLHLRNAPTQLMKDLSYHKGYKYSHNFEDHFTAEQNYLPDKLKNRQYYYPQTTGKEKEIKDRLNELWGKSGKKKY